MRSQSCFALIVSACLLPSTVFAQGGADPFGAGADPFGGGGAISDPFGDNASKERKANAMVDKAKAAIRNGREPIRVGADGVGSVEEKIQVALDQTTTQTFIETPLTDAMQTISQVHGIPIVVDTRALEEIGLAPDTSVSLSLRNVSLRSFLRLMLRDLDLTYMVKDQVMQVTTVEAAEQNLILEMYQLPPKFAAKAQPLLKIMQSTVVPDTWETLGGASTAYSFDHLLIISTTSDVHDQVKAFLKKLVEKYGEG